MMRAQATSEMATTPIATGEVGYSVSVNVVFEIG